ncbi:alpha/beta hydrolase [Pseudomonas sp. DC3200b2]|uniref:alpha/beta hydrolase n=1 Tax=Pseudomonas sp. DC3200b2 TaxID=2804669 RepID=UPI003CF62297
MNPADLLHPDYRFFQNETHSHWSMANLPAIRARVHAEFKPAAQSRAEQRWITTGSESLRLCLYWPMCEPGEQGLAAVLYLHGGGFVLGCPEMQDDYLADLATDLGVLIVAVDYRLAPEHPFPIPLEDCHAGLAWLFDHSAELGVDPTRVALMGHSAGGGLAAGLALLVRDRGIHALCGCVLVYPMLDHRTGQPDTAVNSSTGTFSWDAPANQFCWACYRGEHPLADLHRGWYSPALAQRLDGLPATFICVGALDLFLEEDLAYGVKLSRAGIPVELHVYPGVPHMFDQYPGTLSDQCHNDVSRALQRMLTVPIVRP